MPSVPNSPYTVAVPQIDPDGAAVSEAYAPKPKSFFLESMLTRLELAGLRLYGNRAGSVVHRFFDSIALELARLDAGWGASLARARRDAIYTAFSSGFQGRLPATFATGYFTFTRATPAPADEIIPIDTRIATSDGRTAITLAPGTVLANGTNVTVPVRAEAPGPAGNLAVGTLRTVLSSLPGIYSGINPTPIDGGNLEESDLSIAARWDRYLLGLGTSSEVAILAAAEPVTFVSGPTTYGVRDLALVRPWRIPGFNRNPGVFYVVVESGGGTAPPGLVAAVQAAIEPKIAAGVEGIAIECAPFALPVTIEYRRTAGANDAAIQAAMTDLWSNAFAGSFIENGAGRGRVDLGAVIPQLFGASSDVTYVNVLSGSQPLSPSITPPVGYRLLAGTIAFTILP